MEAISSSETSIHTGATRRNILEDGILHSHRRENIKSYILLTCFSYLDFILRVQKFIQSSLGAPALLMFWNILDSSAMKFSPFPEVIKVDSLVENTQEIYPCVPCG
jgi:hypothetical protein